MVFVWEMSVPLLFSLPAGVHEGFAHAFVHCEHTSALNGGWHYSAVDQEKWPLAPSAASQIYIVLLELCPGTGNCLEMSPIHCSLVKKSLRMAECYFRPVMDIRPHLQQPFNKIPHSFFRQLFPLFCVFDKSVSHSAGTRWADFPHAVPLRWVKAPFWFAKGKYSNHYTSRTLEYITFEDLKNSLDL